MLAGLVMALLSRSVPAFTGGMARSVTDNGDCAAPLDHLDVTPTWNAVANPSPEYRLDLELAIDASGNVFSAEASLAITATSYEDQYPDTANDALGSTTMHFRYRVKIVRISDGTVIETLTGTQLTLSNVSECE